MVIKLDIKYVARVTALELADHPPRLEVPNLHGPVVACAHQAAAARVERQCANEEAVPHQRAETRPRRGGPYFNLAVVRARDN